MAGRSRQRQRLGPVTYLATLMVLNRSWTDAWRTTPEMIAEVGHLLDTLRNRLGLSYMEGM